MARSAGGDAAAFLLRRQLLASVKAAAKQYEEFLNIDLKNFLEKVGDIPTGAKSDANRAIGESARQAMISGFEKRTPKRSLDGYRPNNRYVGGILRALSDPAMVEADAQTIRIINEDVLDVEAAHWRRLNFGAGEGSEGGITAPGRFAIVDDTEGYVVATIGLDADPRPGFVVPRGAWLQPGGRESQGGASSGALGTGEFWPSGELGGKGIRGRTKLKQTRGIASTNFLDPGLQAMARRFPIEYGNMFRTHIEQAAVGLKSKVIG